MLQHFPFCANYVPKWQHLFIARHSRHQKRPQTEVATVLVIAVLCLESVHIEFMKSKMTSEKTRTASNIAASYTYQQFIKYSSHAHVCACVRACVRVCLSVCYVCLSVCLCACVTVYLCVYVDMYVCPSVRLPACLSVSVSPC